LCFRISGVEFRELLNEWEKRMKQMTPYIETKNYSICPCCGEKDSSIDHLLGKNTQTWWYCDTCGGRYKIEFKSDGSVFVEPTGEKVNKHFVLLRNGDLGLVVEGMSFSPSDESVEYHHEYYYNEHTCPINYMKHILAVIDLKYQDQDPHGIFEYVTTLDYDKGVEGCNFDFSDLIKEFK
jgi:hypothetical protein